MQKDSKKVKSEPQAIPNLPHGQGNISWIPGRNKFLYKKNINGQRKSVLGDTVKEVMEKMNRLEREGRKGTARQKVVVLGDAMMDWLDTYKKPKLKKTSYDTLRKTISSRIVAYDIGAVRLTEIDSDMIQKHLNRLNEKEHLSYSTIKKCYDALNDFYRNRTVSGKLDRNPMLAVEMLNKENIVKEPKKIEFFENDDIRKFIGRASEIRAWSKRPLYQYGFCLCANIYLGMRAGELLALRWRDVDFENSTIYVHENLQLVSNLGGVPAQVYETQSLKNYQNRTRDGKHAAVTYLSSNIKAIEHDAGTTVKAHGTHVIRHTCASLYFRKGVRVELIASLLGHSVDVCRNTYIHFVEEQKKAAVKLIDDFDMEQ